MKASQDTAQGRVRRSSTEEANQAIDNQIVNNIQKYANAGPEAVENRLKELDQEWDIERALEVNASTLALSGLLLGVFKDRRWLILPGAVTTFLLQHGLQGWCPPLPLLRKLGLRTRVEIDEERYALKAMRGDFKEIHSTTPAQNVLDKLRS